METIIPPIRLIHWTRWFNSVIFEGKDKPIEGECLIPEGYQVNMTSDSWCTITTNQDEVDTADAFIFHAADYSSNDVPKRTGSPWILYTLESPLTASFRQDPQLMKSFDYLASYHQKSKYFFTYFNPSVMDVANRPLPTDFIRRKSKQAPILWIAKNCHASNGREHYISELMKYIKVDSYGECLNTKPFPPDKTREQLMTEYKFYLAIENANCEDYVTEKLVDTLKFSAVPIVDGPSSYDGYLPNQRSAIRMDAYPDPRDLAKYIHFLDNNDDAYLAYFKHRQQALIKPPSERMDPLFVSLWSDQTAHNYRVSWCSICRHIAATWTSRHGSDSKIIGNRLDPPSETKDLLLVDDTCTAGVKWIYAADGPPYQSYSWTPSLKDEFAYQAIVNPNETILTNTSMSATLNPALHTVLESPLESSEEVDSLYLQERIGMLVLIFISFTVTGYALWAVYRGSRKYKTFINRNLPHF